MKERYAIPMTANTMTVVEAPENGQVCASSTTDFAMIPNTGNYELLPMPTLPELKQEPNVARSIL